jgi:hypothetical protein
MSGNQHDVDTSSPVYESVLAVIRDLSVQLGTMREQVRQDLADYLARYREDAYRATMALATRVTRIELQMEDDAALRRTRQRHLDRLLIALLMLMLVLVAGVVAIAVLLWRRG